MNFYQNSVVNGEEVVKTVSDLNNLAMFDFALFNRYQKQHLASATLFLGIKINNGNTVRPREIMEGLQVPEEVFR